MDKIKDVKMLVTRDLLKAVFCGCTRKEMCASSTLGFAQRRMAESVREIADELLMGKIQPNGFKLNG